MVALLAENVDAESLTVREQIPGELVTIEKGAEIESAATLLADHDINRLPVCEAGDSSASSPRRTSRVTCHTSLGEPRTGPSVSSGPTRHRPRRPTTTPTGPSSGSERSRCRSDTVRFRKELPEADVRDFAEATGDTNRIHLNDDFAEQTQFGGPIAHGILTAGLISAALARLPGLTIYLSQDLRFLGPVEIGKTITAVCEVVEDLGKEKFELTTTVYDGEVVVDGKTVVLVTEPPREAETQTAQLQ